MASLSFRNVEDANDFELARWPEVLRQRPARCKWSACDPTGGEDKTTGTRHSSSRDEEHSEHDRPVHRVTQGGPDGGNQEHVSIPRSGTREYIINTPKGIYAISDGSFHERPPPTIQVTTSPEEGPPQRGV